MNRVLIVDDHPDFRRFARSMLEAEGLDVVGEAEDEASAVEAAARLRPDAVLLDAVLPGSDGFAVAERLRALDPELAIVLTSSRAAEEFAPGGAHPRARGAHAWRSLRRAGVLAA